MAEHPHGSGHAQPFSECRQHFGNPVGSGFEPIERRIAARAEGRATCLATQGLSSFVLPMRAVTEEGMDLCISDLIVETGAIGTGKPLGQNAFGSAAPAFAFAPGCQGGIVNLTTARMMWYHRSHDNNRILAHVQGLPLPRGDYQSRRVALLSILPQLSRRGRTAGSARDRPHV